MAMLGNSSGDASQRDLVCCPNCDEQIKAKAIVCRFCQTGVSPEHFRSCPFCFEMVRRQAKLCRFCRSELDEAVNQDSPHGSKEGKPKPLFQISDQDLDLMFSENLGVTDQPSVEKGKAADGMARLVPGEKLPESGKGRIGAIGKFLLDSKDMDRIGKVMSNDLSPPGWRSLPMEATTEIKLLLRNFDSQKDVIGSLITGMDGFVLVNTMPLDVNAELMSVLSLAFDLNVGTVLQIMRNDRIHQMAMKTEQNYLVNTKFASGLLVSLSLNMSAKDLTALMRSHMDTIKEIERIIKRELG